MMAPFPKARDSHEIRYYKGRAYAVVRYKPQYIPLTLTGKPMSFHNDLKEAKAVLDKDLAKKGGKS